jgi:hypothetical protein
MIFQYDSISLHFAIAVQQQLNVQFANKWMARGGVVVKGAIHSQLNWAILLCDVIPDGKTE